MSANDTHVCSAPQPDCDDGTHPHTMEKKTEEVPGVEYGGVGVVKGDVIALATAVVQVPHDLLHMWYK